MIGLEGTLAVSALAHNASMYALLLIPLIFFSSYKAVLVVH